MDNTVSRVFNEFDIDPQGCLTKYNGEAAHVDIPEGVTSIGDGAFRRCTSLNNVTIPESVKSIGNGAFYKCSSLEGVTIPDSVTSIGEQAFSCCYSLTKIKLPKGVTSIGNGAFRHSTRLNNVTIPDSVTSIGEDTFRHCSNLKSVTIPDSVTSIGEGAFSHCPSLKSVKIAEAVESIGGGAFANCSSLSEINIPKSVKSIGKWAFLGCKSLQSVIIPESVKSIDEGAFRHCSSLTTTRIPASVTVIEEYTFSDCNKLEFIVIDNEAEREKICRLLPDDFHSKVITKAAYQYHLKEKEKKIVSILSEYLLENASQNTTRHQPNILTTTVLSYLNETKGLSGTPGLLRIIFSFLPSNDIIRYVPDLAKVVNSIVFSNVDVPRSDTTNDISIAKYNNSLNDYEKALQHAVTQYATVSTEIIESESESETAVTASNRHCKR
jgi:hypothetical protein